MTRRSPTLVAGVDSSTQSCKVVTVDLETGHVRGSAALPHPDATEVDPEAWWDAFTAVGAAELNGVSAVSVSAQQHSTILLDDTGAPVTHAILWNDNRAAGAANELRREFGEGRWAAELGVIPTAAHPVSKLRWLRRTDPEAADRVRTVLVPHDWLTWRLLGAQSAPTTDRSDASGTGYWSPMTLQYRQDLIELAFGRSVEVPVVLGPAERSGVTAGGVVVGAGCGDNAAALLGLDAAPGEAVVSIGTSMTVSMQEERVVVDPSGRVTNLASAMGGQLPIVATHNGARTLTAMARMLRVGLDELDAMAAHAANDADGITFLPYLDGERTPKFSAAQGAVLGLTRASMTSENLARAAVLGLACSIARAIADLVGAGLVVDAVTLVGGGAQSSALRQAVADLTGRVVTWPTPREYAAIGAARQAAWALTGSLPQWPRPPMSRVTPRDSSTWADRVLENHEHAERMLFGAESV